MLRLAVSVVILAVVLEQTDGHGYMIDPPNRSSMWRLGYKTPVCHRDNAFHCGKSEIQEQYGGRCGECGDVYGSPRPRQNENTGKYGRGIVTRRYRAGQVITATVNITANHKGWFRFSLCPLTSAEALEEESCFQRNVLQLADNPNSSQFYLPHNAPALFEVKLQLPANLTCERCVMQWHYQANKINTCSDGRRDRGCGPQPMFRSCADIAIEP
ncbi:hypothetical protein B566_EDAN009438 [Ephemera danica]|nr:hypothetical protein B566_EDAN009438 [Ephemera danica]